MRNQHEHGSVTLRTLFIFWACMAMFFSAQPAVAAQVSRIVAVVNGDMITALELEKACAPEFFGQKVDPAKDVQKAEDIQKAVLQQMIDEKIILQQAEKDGISVSDDEVNEALEQMIKSNNVDHDTFLNQIAKEGLSEEMIRKRIRSQMISQQLMARNVINKVVITEDEINDYYRKNMAGIASGRARVAIIVYPVDVDAEKYASDIQSGRKSFADVARSVSIGPSPEDGGDLGFMDLSDMAPALLEQVSLMKKGDVSPLMRLPANYAQIALLDVDQGDGEAASDATPDPATAQRIEQILRRPRVEERFKQYTEQLRAKSLIELRG